MFAHWKLLLNLSPKEASKPCESTALPISSASLNSLGSLPTFSADVESIASSTAEIETELKRVQRVVSNRMNAIQVLLDDEIPRAISRLTSPFQNKPKALYALRKFLASYVKERAVVFGPTYTPTASMVSLIMEREEKDAAMARYITSLQNQVAKLCRRFRSTEIVAALSTLLNFEKELVSFSKLVEQQATDVEVLIKRFHIHTSTLNHSTSDGDMLNERLQNICKQASSWLESSQTVITDLIKVMSPDIQQYGCCICLDVKFKPVLIQTCKHDQFCFGCLENFQLYQPPGPHVYLDSPGMCPCPLCRNVYLVGASRSDIMVDTALDNFLRSYFPKETKIREKEEQWRVQKLSWRRFVRRQRVKMLRLVYGRNYYRYF
ncbi:hypothetical protein SmJEL517_g03827 [Synchytrium microbalum]|uniref:RING-type domain-containing protein n=1 Tax=Synchytrium microbalum TaxID=1806994 RepID=A0A507C2E4_9FUNG|nr:uncharacterized protein SmJEL517_g03827 [Synchytrium microbalum]TPX33219.1 hypothetical protein SmJEL517_g03827 [Synchytrium microbalum]